MPKPSASPQASTDSRDPSSIQVRVAEPSDRTALQELMEGTVAAAPVGPRNQWLYEQGPDGKAWTWVAAQPSGELLGCTTIIPRRFWIDGQAVMGGIGLDAWVRPEHRRRGIVSRLHAASRLAMRTGEAPFQFMAGPPVPENLDALLKCGARVVGPLRFVGLPLTAEGLRVAFNMLGGWSQAVTLTPGVDLLLAGIRRVAMGLGRWRGLRVSLVTRVGAAFDELFDQATVQHRVIGRRDAAFLAWRYLQNPVVGQRLLAVWRGDSLVAWAAVERSSKGWLMVDHLLPLDRSLATDALSALVSFAAEQGAIRLALRLNLESPDARTFLGHAFLPGRTREQQQVLCDDPLLWNVLSDAGGWHFTSGDLAPEATPWWKSPIDPQHAPRTSPRAPAASETDQARG